MLFFIGFVCAVGFLFVHGVSSGQVGELITATDSVYGYRRYEVYGKGRSNGKEGIWWVVNSSPKFTTEDLARIYQDFWGTNSSIYIESYHHNSEFK